MKKIFLILSAVFTSFFSFAQEDRVSDTGNVLQDKNSRILSKRGREILPEKGEYSISVDAGAFFSYFTGLFRDGGNLRPAPGWLQPVEGDYFEQAITGRYFRDNNSAIRARVRVSHFHAEENVYVPFPVEQERGEYENTTITRASEVELSLGIEERKGISRVQGYYGAEFLFSLSTASVQTEYGEPLDSLRARTGEVERVLEENPGGTVLIGPRGFVGVQYFFAPKISLGLEYGWGFYYSNTKRGDVVIERYHIISNKPEEYIDKDDRSGSSFILDTDLHNLELSLSFFF